ncbi:3-deoxy-D-manno-octulosonic acid transferase [uncultured Gammaproteobacteria bacterium]
MLQSLYRTLTHLGGPLIECYLNRRTAAGKEDAQRRHERMGRPTLPRPPGPLIWLHAASVGEALSVLTLIDRLLALDPSRSILVTTGTVTSAGLMALRLPPRAFHQYVPVDRPDWVAGFLDYWHPDLALWIESELWPNLLWQTRQRGIAAVLINARISDRSFRRWQRVPRLIGSLLASFRLCLAQSEADAKRLRALGAAEVRCPGNLKYSAAPPPADEPELVRLRAIFGQRPLWLLVSSHPGEDQYALATHATLAPRLPSLMTLIVPRHPKRGAEIAALARNHGLSAALRSECGTPPTDTAVYVADTLGEMGLWLRLTPVACIGGSLIPHGGHNPIEPAQLGCAIIHGPHMFNFREIVAELSAANAALAVTDGTDLSEAVAALLTDGKRRQRLSDAALVVAERNRLAIESTLEALAPLLPPGVSPPNP